MEELFEHLMRIIEDNDERFTFEYGVNSRIHVYDKETGKGYVLIVKPFVLNNQSSDEDQ